MCECVCVCGCVHLLQNSTRGRTTTQFALTYRDAEIHPLSCLCAPAMLAMCGLVGASSNTQASKNNLTSLEKSFPWCSVKMLNLGSVWEALYMTPFSKSSYLWVQTMEPGWLCIPPGREHKGGVAGQVPALPISENKPVRLL